MGYKQLSVEERHYIEIENKGGRSANCIAKALSRSQTTISRELERNCGKRSYRHKQANKMAQERHKGKKKL